MKTGWYNSMLMWQNLVRKVVLIIMIMMMTHFLAVLIDTRYWPISKSIQFFSEALSHFEISLPAPQ
jgi:hypothetical protein